MYQITKIAVELLSLQELLRARDAMKMLQNLDVHETDVDVRRLVNELISKKEQSQI